MAHSAVAIANSFWDIAQAAGQPVDPMKVQKLVYFAHGWHLGYERGVLSVENAEAWRWGPVFPDLYHAVKHWGSGTIPQPIRAVEYNGYELRWNDPRMSSQDEFAQQLARRVWEVYGPMSGPALSHLTHEKDGPWYQTWRRAPGVRGVVIPNPVIERHFKQKLEENAKRSESAALAARPTVR